MTFFARSVGVAVLLAVFAGAAYADPIGSFSYTLDPANGPIITVQNDALFTLGLPDAAFLDGTVRLFDGGTEVEQFTFDFVGAGDNVRFFSSLFELTAGSASLNFTFSVPGSVATDPLSSLNFVFDLNGLDPVDPSVLYAGSFSDPESNSVVIDFTPEPTQAVPEPETMTALLAGLAALSFGRAIDRKTAA